MGPCQRSQRGHPTPFTHEEAALLRQLRFGRLPEPIPPEQWVEAVETDTAFEPPRAEHGLGEPYGG